MIIQKWLHRGGNDNEGKKSFRKPFRSLGRKCDLGVWRGVRVLRNHVIGPRALRAGAF